MCRLHSILNEFLIFLFKWLAIDFRGPSQLFYGYQFMLSIRLVCVCF